MYLFSLTYDDDLENILYFPIVYDEYATDYKTLNKTISTVTGDEMTIIKNEPLREFKFKSLLPKDNLLLDNKSVWKNPLAYLNRLRQFKLDKKPIRFIILRKLESGEEIFSTNLLVTLESYSVIENAGEEGDFYLDVTLKEYRAIQSKKIVVDSTNKSTGKIKATEDRQRSTKDPSKTYTVKKGDTLWEISRKHLGNGNKWQEIAKKNNISNPRKLKIGQVLKL